MGLKNVANSGYWFQVADMEILERLNDPNRYNYYNFPQVLMKPDDTPLAVMGAGREDMIYFFQDTEEENEIIVMNRNSRVGYIGLEIFDTEAGEKVWDIDFQNSDYEEVREMGTLEFIEHAFQRRE